MSGIGWRLPGWPLRDVVTVDTSAAPGGGLDVAIPLPTDHRLWGEALADGADLRVTDSTGELLTYKLGSYNPSTRTGTVYVTGWTPPALALACPLWLWWRNPGASSAAGAFTPSPGALTGTVGPRSLPPVDPMVPGFLTRWQKAPVEVWALVADFTRVLGTVARGAEVSSVTAEVLDGNGSPVPGMLGSVLLVGRPGVIVVVSGGTDGSAYTVAVRATLTDGSTHEALGELSVRDLA